ncbi:DivIVA domain-containing protein [Micromonospora sp. NPDC093277]|uniref:DivIVA domain-containing protein n=1 Tax=Micromonospora sp. NPDC093277 TaxID=3364291 RepID=UPI00380118D3
MSQVLLILVVALTVAAVMFGVTVLVSGRDPGLAPTEPDGRAVPLPGGRPLQEGDVAEARFDTALRGYRMAQVDQAMRRAAYDIGYKSELIGVLEAEVAALREGRTEEADALRRTREEAVGKDPAAQAPADGTTADADGSAAEAGVAAAPAAAAVEDETAPATDVPAPAGPLAPIAAPADQEPAGRPVALRPPATESTGEQAAADDADAEDERERGGVVRSETA